MEKVNSKLHWTTLYSEKILLAVIGTLTMLAAGMDIYNMVLTLKISLADLFLLFIYAEIIGMVGAFYISNRIPVTLPIVIAMTALCRLIVLHSKDADPWVLIAEAGAILVLGGAAYIMSYKDKLSLEKEQLRKQNESS
jgi:protein PsiE